MGSIRRPGRSRRSAITAPGGTIATTPPTGIDPGNLTLWLDPTTLSAGLVASWVSSEGGAHDFTAVGAARPTRAANLAGHASVDFDGANSILNDLTGATLDTYLDNAQSWTAAFVAKDTGSGADSGLYFFNPSIFSDGGSGFFGFGTTTTTVYAGQDGAGGNYDSAAQAGSAVHYYIAKFVKASMKIFISVDGGAFDAGTTVGDIGTLTGTPTIGKALSALFKGSLGDIAIWKSLLSDANIGLVQAYLAAKYA